MVSGGGTGGHIFPAVSIADELKKRHPNAEFLFVGAKDRMEMERVPLAGYAIEGLWISGIQRKLTASNLSFPFKLISSLWKCQRLLKKFKPDAVIGTGGFASGPLLFAAAKKGIPCLIQEQNSYPGITNKILAGRVQKICVAYPKMERFFPKDKLLLTGNPIRQTVQNINSNKAKAIAGFGLNPEKRTLLILGGSLGARKINQLVSQNLIELKKLGINILWQTGKLYFDALQEKHAAQIADDFQMMPFIKNMEDAYAADVIISRAGAGTISELAVAKKATLLIPSPNVAEDHQTKNAMALVAQSAALIYRESEEETLFIPRCEKLLKSKNQLEANIATLALPQAAEQIANEIDKMIADAK